MKVLGLSGGADSVYLFHRLRSSGDDFRCIYVNHNMNVHDDAAERFCRELCAEHAIQLKVIDVNQPLKNETEAREARYRAFKQDVKDEVLVLAHHMDDVVETMLMNLCRGTSFNGMSGIAAEGTIFGIKFERPLIQHQIGRAGIHMYLLANELTWYQDETNDDTTIIRNQVRHELIPLMEQMFPDCAKKIADFSDDCKLANEVMCDNVRKKYNNFVVTQKRINGSDIQRFWFFDWMSRENQQVSKRHYAEFVAFIDNPQYREMSLPNGFVITKVITINGELALFCENRDASRRNLDFFSG